MTLTIKHKIQISILAICAITSLIQAWISISQLQQETEAAIQANVTETSRATSFYISDWLNQRKVVLQANETSIAQGQETIAELKQTLNAAGFMSIFVGRQDGSLTYVNQQGHQQVNVDPRSRPWYRQAQQQGAMITTEPYMDVETGSSVITLAKAFNQSSQGVVGADLQIDQIAANVAQLQIDNQGSAFLIDGNNKVLAHENRQLLNQAATDLDRQLSPQYISQQRQTQHLDTVLWRNTGKEMLLQFTPIEGTNWTLGIVQDKQLAFASVNEQIWDILISSLIMVVIVNLLAGVAINHMFRPLGELTHAVEALANGKGDLTHRFKVKRADEIGQLSLHMNQFLQTLQKMVQAINQDTLHLNDRIDHTATTACQANGGVAKQHDELTQIATATRQMSATANEVAGHAESTANAAKQSAQYCVEGGQVIGQSAHSIEQLSHQLNDTAEIIINLEKHTAEIEQILATIQSVAEQTNLLALNAAIEAARAGEQGRGFAVVADEVRVLSHRTQDSTEEIRATIATLQQTSQQAVSAVMSSTATADSSVQLAQQAQQSLEQITLSITEINDMATHIASAAEQQRAASGDISRNTQEINQVSNEIALQTQDVSDNAAAMLATSAELTRHVSRFKIN
ncbi:methyl-accepting chemotaxis protein [Shewanella sp. Scap07]|uniref:methyl-accepting chemotaxis protein n=1 Tax=Shewanella sp. Scap07 TaxID=2589987 RepID=UPI0015B97D8E|nr:methyl-accepting chemotaxis protein [Shewanella sp. Scap07]QLE86852.1 methyl-accepting chemotaxis protein [Shewanella sp. Scap07]